MLMLKINVELHHFTTCPHEKDKLVGEKKDECCTKCALDDIHSCGVAVCSYWRGKAVGRALGVFSPLLLA